MKSIRFFKGLSWLIILNLLVKPVWLFFIDRQVQNTVGYEDYGTYFSILNLSYVLYFLSDLGLSNSVNQRMANHQPVHVAQLLRIKVLLLLGYGTLFCFIAWLTHVYHWEILAYVTGIQSLTSLLIFLRSIVTGNQYFSTDAWFSILDKSLMIVLCGWVLYGSVWGTISLLFFLQIQLMCTAVTVLICLLFVIKKHLIVRPEKQQVEAIFRQVAPFTIIILLMSVHYRLDGFLLERIHANGAVEAGIYASAYRLLDAGNMVGYLASSFLVAFVARHLKDRPSLEEAVFNTRHALMLCSTGVTVFVLLFAPWLQQLLYHSVNPYHVLVMQLCIAAFPGYCLVHVYGSVLTGAARFTPFIRMLLWSVGINIVLNLFWIPSYGALGCCMAALVSQYTCGIGTMIKATKTLALPYQARSMVVYLAAAALLAAFFYAGKFALINVWVILVVAICFSLAVLATQLSFFKKYFVSLR